MNLSRKRRLASQVANDVWVSPAGLPLLVLVFQGVVGVKCGENQDALNLIYALRGDVT
jgi:hypothetical protein